MGYERINEDPRFNGKIRNSHEARYHIASGFVEGGDRIVDFGCGVGYGEPILVKGNRNIAYFGLDKNPARSTDWQRNFEEPFETIKHFDVAIAFEIIEHLNNLDHFVSELKKSKKWILVSTPIIPTKHRNEYHVRDFTEQSLIDLFIDDNWELFANFKQLEIYGIFIFKRKQNG